MSRRSQLAGALLALSTIVATAVSAEPIFPAGRHPALDAQMSRHERQFYTFNARPFGLSLDAHPRDEGAIAAIAAFLAQDDSDDVAAVTGQHAYELLASYGEYGDLGFFGGVALAGTAFHYIALKREGVTGDELVRARERVVRAAESWHVFYVVTGGGGLVARGIRRMEGEDPDEPPLPVTYPEMVPLFDEDGAPLPQPKNNGTYRWDNSGGVLPDGVWIWKDSCSKDQLIGQILGLVTLHDAMKDDPDIDQALVARLQEDARLVAEMLMAPRDIAQLEVAEGEGVYDLIIMDADGRPTFHHDVNPLSLEKFYMDPGAGFYNLFNLVMAWGAMKGLHHVTGDARIEEYLYVELLALRDFMAKLLKTAAGGAMDYIYAGIRTNFDNPDMTGVALWLALYLETDPDVSAVLRTFLETRWWDREGESHTARRCKQPLWHAIYLGVTDRGASPELAEELRDLLLAFELGPYVNEARLNCDEAEIAARECLAVDGETVLRLEGRDDGGRWMAAEALDPSIRPPSNFDARSNPFSVNGGGGLRLNPGGDLLAAYWMSRALEANPAGAANRSTFARDHMPVGGRPETPPEATPDVGIADVGADTAADNVQEDAGRSEIAAELLHSNVDTQAPGEDSLDAGPEPAAPRPGGGGGGGCGVSAGGDRATAVLLALVLASAVAVSRRRTFSWNCPIRGCFM